MFTRFKKTKKRQDPVFSVLDDFELKQVIEPVRTHTPPSPEEIRQDNAPHHPAQFKTDNLSAPFETDNPPVAINTAPVIPEIQAPPALVVPQPLSIPQPQLQPQPEPAQPVSQVQLSIDDFSFIYIEPGSFLMGSQECEHGRNQDERIHEVTITRGFYLQTIPVTWRLWKSMMGIDPSLRDGEDSHPVVNISWHECLDFINRLNKAGDHAYRLPTEAEWEYACRAGSVTSFANGEIKELFCGYDPCLDTAGWYCGNSGRVHHAAGLKKPNDWGLYDMHGNVFEWCQDWYGPYASEPQTDPYGPLAGNARVVRGGSWFSNARNCRCASRFYWSPNSKSDFIGFRLLKNMNP